MPHTHPPSSTHIAAQPRRCAFTLIEILVVMTIIILIAAVAMPAFRFITGSRSVEGAQNIAGAMLGRARTLSVVDHQVRGVFFYLDPVTDRSTMALVRQDGDNTQNPDLDAYKAWTDGKDQSPLTFNVPYNDDKTAALGPSFANLLTLKSSSGVNEVFNLSGPVGAINKPMLRMFKCIQTHAVANAGNSPVGGPNAFWGPASPLFLEIIDNTDTQLLPQGVGVQLMNDTKGGASNDRYLRTGVILFDGTGQFASVNYDVLPNSKLGQTLRLVATKSLQNSTYNAGTGVVQPPAYRLFSQFGLVLYDRELLKNASNINGTAFIPSEGDFMIPASVYSTAYLPAPATLADEQNEEKWLDTNTLPLLINRSNGTLIKGE